MRQAQVLVYESDGRLAQRLDVWAQIRKVWLRELRSVPSCLNALRRGGPGVLVLRLGRDLEQEMGLLEQVSWLFPDTASVVVGDTDNPILAGLAWDLGARCVLFPPQPVEILPEIVERLLPAEVTETP